MTLPASLKKSLRASLRLCAFVANLHLRLRKKNFNPIIITFQKPLCYLPPFCLRGKPSFALAQKNFIPLFHRSLI
jgi:hypothetical protein